MTRAGRKSRVKQCLGFCTADFWSLLTYESAEQKRKHCLTLDFLSALVLPEKRQLTVDVDRSEGAFNEKLEGRGKVFVALVYARHRNALLKLLDVDLAVLQCKRKKGYPATPLSPCEEVGVGGGGPPARWSQASYLPR